jgi:hypothetical protein
MKRKAISSLGGIETDDHKWVLLRDADGSTYPSKDIGPGKKQTWCHSYFLGHYYDGIRCEFREYFAYLHDDGKQWDYVPAFNDVEYNVQSLMWQEDDERRKRWEERERIATFWGNIPEKNRGWLKVSWYIPYESIVAIDGDGDNYARCPHIYVPFNDAWRIMSARLRVNEEIFLNEPNFDNRIEFFPTTFPDLPEPKPKVDEINPKFS